MRTDDQFDKIMAMLMAIFRVNAVTAIVTSTEFKSNEGLSAVADTLDAFAVDDSNLRD